MLQVPYDRGYVDRKDISYILVPEMKYVLQLTYSRSPFQELLMFGR